MVGSPLGSVGTAGLEQRHVENQLTDEDRALHERLELARNPLPRPQVWAIQVLTLHIPPPLLPPVAQTALPFMGTLVVLGDGPGPSPSHQ